MEMRKLSKDLVTSMLGMGLMRLPTHDDQIDYDHTRQMIDYLIEHGVNYFDTAYFYHGGKSEVVAHDLLISRYPRDSFILTDKLPYGDCKTEEDVMKKFNTQMERLKTDYIDIYLVHGLNDEGWEHCKKYDLMSVFEKLKSQGRIRHIGFSFHGSPEGLRKILTEYDNWDVYQVQLNYLDYYVHGYDKLYKVMEEFDIPCIVMEPLKGGTITKLPEELTTPFRAADPDASIASWGVRWCGTLPKVTVVLSGMSTIDHVKDNVATFSPFKPLTAQDEEIIKQVVELVNRRPVIPCTDCKYCIECPMSINIPKIFDAYNEYIRYENRGHTHWRYNNEFSDSEKPESCTRCGNCLEKCPQHINIPDELVKAHALLSRV